MRKTKIIATLGPATNSVEIIKELITAGLDGARINFSHGTHESHSVIINMLKQAREELGANVPLILDTKGPEIRTKSLKNGTVRLEIGKFITVTSEDIVGDETIVATTYEGLANDMEVGGCILIDDGLIELKVKEINGNKLVCEIMNSGVLGENKGVNLPNVSVNLPALTQKDINDIIFGIKMDFDFIAASFVRSAADVMSVKKVLKENNGEHIKIISKIENREGVDNIDEILKVTDAIMVARGDLGVEVPLEEVPIIQKMLIKKSKKASKLVITATHLLESMIVNPRPTRAEASDVANAVFDSTDAIMLSGETAKGDYPVESIKMMAKIALNTERNINYNENILAKNNKLSDSVTDAITNAACISAAELNCPFIITITKSGYSTSHVVRFRPQTPIIAVTPDLVVKRQLQLSWGTTPIYCEKNITTNNELFEEAIRLSEDAGIVKKGDLVVLVAGVPVGLVLSTNIMKIHSIGQPVI
jgi:pyruvate kinase